MPKTKDSGVEWLGEIPESWTICKCKYLFSYRKQIVGNEVSNFERLALTLNGVIKRSKDDDNGLQPTDFSTYQILRTNQLVFKLIDLQNVSTSRVGLSSFDGIVSPAYIILEPSKSISPKFAEQYFLMLWHRQIFNQLGDAGVRSSLNAGDLLDVPFVLPPIDTQNNIVNFLDSKKIWIKSLTDNLNNQIDKLKDYKKALIAKCVTKGLDPNVPLKDSGIDWIGEMPKDWAVCKLKYICISHNSNYSKDILFNEGLYPVYGASGVEVGYLNTFEYDKPYLGIVKDGAGVGRIDIFPANSSLLATMAYIYPAQSFDLRWLKYLITSMNLGLSLDKTTIPHIYFSEYGNRYVPIYNLSRQIEMADYLDKKCSEIDSLIASKQEQIDKLNEYQKSLIYEYVTGKKEVV